MTADALERESNFSREWLETNGLGGWASSTVSGAHTRRYHGLLVVATCPPVGRVVLLSRLDETLVLSTGRVELSCSIFPGTIHPRGDQWLTAFAPEPVPTWTYAGEGWMLCKRLALLAGEHSLVVSYELVEASEPLWLELRPLFAGRDYHHLMQANDQVARTAAWTDDVLAYQSYPDQPTAYIYAADASWKAAPDWYYNFQYPCEEERGLDYSEDLFTPGYLRLQLAPGATVGVIAATEPPAGRDPLALLADEIDRRQQVEVRASWAADPLATVAVAGDRSVSGAARRRPAHHCRGLPLVHGLGPRHHDRPARPVLGHRALCRGAGHLRGVCRARQRGHDTQPLSRRGRSPGIPRCGCDLVGFSSRSTSICNTPRTTSLPASCGRR